MCDTVLFFFFLKKRETRPSFYYSINFLLNTSEIKRLHSTAFCLEVGNVLKRSINPVYSASCACQNPSEIQVKKVDTAQPSRRPEKPDCHLVDNPPPPPPPPPPRRRVTKGYKKRNSQVSPASRQNNYISDASDRMRRY